MALVTPCRPSASKRAPGCTPARSRYAATTTAGSPWASARGSAHWPGPTMCSLQSTLCDLVIGSLSVEVARRGTSSRACSEWHLFAAASSDRRSGVPSSGSPAVSAAVGRPTGHRRGGARAWLLAAPHCCGFTAVDGELHFVLVLRWQTVLTPRCGRRAHAGCWTVSRSWISWVRATTAVTTRHAIAPAATLARPAAGPAAPGRLDEVHARPPQRRSSAAATDAASIASEFVDVRQLPYGWTVWLLQPLELVGDGRPAGAHTRRSRLGPMLPPQPGRGCWWPHRRS